MNELTLTRRGLRIQVVRQRTKPVESTQQRYFPAGKLALRFPELENNTLPELDTWLQGKGKGHLICLHALPRNRRLLNGLVDLAAEHNVGILIKPTQAHAKGHRHVPA